MPRLLALALAGLALGGGMSAPPTSSSPLFAPRAVTVDGVERRYRIFRPRGARPAAGWPTILFLHGSGERGDDGELPTRVGLGPAIARDPESFPFAVVFPQVPEGATWSPPHERAALAALDATVAEVDGDADRVALVGLSMGGNGALRIAARHPGRFAALVVVCGFPGVPGGRLTEAERAAYDLGNPFLDPAAGDPFAAAATAVAALPVWLAHGREDPLVPAGASGRLAGELAARGATVTLRLFPGVGHGAWEPALAEPELWSWLSAQRRRGVRELP